MSIKFVGDAIAVSIFSFYFGICTNGDAGIGSSKMIYFHQHVKDGRCLDFLTIFFGAYRKMYDRKCQPLKLISFILIDWSP